MTRVGLIIVNEIRQLGFAFGVIASNAHNVPSIVGGFGNEVDQCLAHALGMRLVITENNCLGHWVGALEVFPDSSGHEFGAFLQDEMTIKICGVVLALLDQFAVLVGFPFFLEHSPGHQRR